MLLAGDVTAAGSCNLDVRITGTMVGIASCTFSSSDLIKVELGGEYINEIAGNAPAFSATAMLLAEYL